MFPGVQQHLQMENRTNGKWQLPVVCRKREIGTANFHLLAANRNGKRKLFSLVGNL
jgi:hypothetical protein